LFLPAAKKELTRIDRIKNKLKDKREAVKTLLFILSILSIPV
jgi:hypothetical protein